jgi:2-dehydropantoate 2-reductase
VLAEAAATAHALGCRPTPDFEERLARTAQLPHRASILQDLELGRPMEIDGIFGMTVELARLAAVATPTLDLLVGLAKVRARSAGLYIGQDEIDERL